MEGPRKSVAWQRAYVRFIFRNLLANIYENFCSGPPLESILSAPLLAATHLCFGNDSIVAPGEASVDTEHEQSFTDGRRHGSSLRVLLQSILRTESTGGRRRRRFVQHPHHLDVPKRKYVSVARKEVQLGCLVQTALLRLTGK